MLSYVLAALLAAPFVAARVAGLLRPPCPTSADVLAVSTIVAAILSAACRPADSSRVRLVAVVPPLCVRGVAA
jgi:hypothetical protein